MPRHKDEVFRVRPIGRVVSGRPWGAHGDRWEEGESQIEIDPTWCEALEGIDAFSHIWVIWWLDRAGDPPGELRIHPERRPELPLVGLFATRSPHRPNAVAMTAVRLLERHGHRLRVVGLDAFEGTAVIDLKPYLRRGDLIPEANAPEWLEQLWDLHQAEAGRE